MLNFPEIMLYKINVSLTEKNSYETRDQGDYLEKQCFSLRTVEKFKKKNNFQKIIMNGVFLNYCF